jgi:hypothetical protein
MNRNTFLQYVENSRDCEQDRLDIAVNRGINRAKNDRINSKKLLALAAACVFTFAMCTTVNLKPLKTAVEGYYLNWNKTMLDNTVILDGYMSNIASIVKKNLGGE